MPGIDVEATKKHPVLVTIAICASVAAMTWGAAENMLVAPRDFEIARLQRLLDAQQKQLDEAKQKIKDAPVAAAQENDKFVLQETGVMEKTSAVTSDGECSISVASVIGNIIDLSVVSKTNGEVKFDNLKPGARVHVEVAGHKDALSFTYWINILRLRGDIVDLSVYRQTINPR